MKDNKISTMIATLNANLNPNAEIYKELSEQPDWWQKLLAIKGVYVEIRKGDIVDVYYEGGRMAELRYKNKKLVATCHPKYIGKTVSKGTNPKYEDCFDLLKKNPESIVKNIKDNYSQKGEMNNEDIREKKIQGDMICSHTPIYLDSEFAHRYEEGSQQTIRFDLVTIRDNELLFIELKRIKDNRLLNKDDDEPEILEQMDKYTKFIKANKDKLLEYYKDLYGIKKSLGLPVPECDVEKLSICETPHLIIRDTYEKNTSGRAKRIKSIKSILDKAPFPYSLYKPYKEEQQTKQIKFRESITNKGFTYILDNSERHLNLFNYQNQESVQKVKDYFANHQCLTLKKVDSQKCQICTNPLKKILSDSNN